MKTVSYYNSKIETLKATIRRLNVEKRIAILRERERTLRKQIQQGKCYRDRNIQSAVIKAVAIILVPFISWFLSSHSNKQGISLQKNVSTSLNAETKGNISPAVVNSPNGTMNINTYLAPSQSETRSEVSETDVNRPK
jgi:hypothetical protein